MISGKNDGDGRWMPWPPCAGRRRGSRRTASHRRSGAAASRPSSSSVYLWCQKSSRACDLGDLGEVVLGRRRRDRPLERAAVPRVVAGAARPASLLTITFTRNTSTEKAMMNAPTVAIRFSVSQPSPES